MSEFVYMYAGGRYSFSVQTVAMSKYKRENIMPPPIRIYKNVTWPETGQEAGDVSRRPFLAT